MTPKPDHISVEIGERRNITVDFASGKEVQTWHTCERVPSDISEIADQVVSVYREALEKMGDE